VAFGLDYVSGPPVSVLTAQRVTFVCRYTGYFSGYNLSAISTAQGKCLTPGEAKALGQARIAVVSNYEWYANRAAEGKDSGVWDARTAEKIHAGCGGPSNRPIYFSVDFAPTPAQMGQIGSYFKGVASVLDLTRTAAYGSKAVIEYLFNNKLISYGWQTYGWSGGAWDPRANIRQYQNNMTMDGRSVDYNESRTADFGQWIYGESGMIVPHGWTLSTDKKTLTAPNGVSFGLGFCQYVLNYPGGWDPDNWPMSPEFHAKPLEYSNTSLGEGQKICFKRTTLEWTPERGIFEAWQGQEIYTLLGMHAKEQNPTPTSVNTSAVAADLSAIAAAESKAESDLKQI
jgi:hypothetical protein